MGKVWVEISVDRGGEFRAYVGQVDGTIEDAIFRRAPEDFVRLENVRWLEYDGSQPEWVADDQRQLVVMRNEDMPEEYGADIYLKRSSILAVTPIRPGASVWETGDVEGGRLVGIDLEGLGSHP